MPSFIRNRMLVVSSHGISTTRLKLWQNTDSTGPQRSIIPSTAWTPIGVSPPAGVSAGSARHCSGLSFSAFGNVIVASTCMTTPRSPDRTLSRSLAISG